MTAAHHAGLDEIANRGVEDPNLSPAASDGSSEASLEQRLAVSEAEKAQAERLLREMRTPTPSPRIDPNDLPPEDPGEMPDPSTNPDDFKAWLEKARTLDRWQGEQHALAVRDAAVKNTRSKEIVDAYLMSRPKYQDLREMVIQCYREACAELGVSDLPDNTAALDADVDKRMRALTKAAAAAVDDLPGGGPKDAGLQNKGLPPGRTEGLSGGSKGGAAGGALKKEDEPVVRSLTESMRDRQAESGLF